MSRGIEQRPRSFPGLASARLRENRGGCVGEGACKACVDPNAVGRRLQTSLHPALGFRQLSMSNSASLEAYVRAELHYPSPTAFRGVAKATHARFSMRTPVHMYKDSDMWNDRNTPAPTQRT